MMDWLSAGDVWVFRLVNEHCVGAIFDFLFLLVGRAGFWKWALAAAAAWFLIWGGFKGRIFVALAVLGVVIGDPLIVNPIKKTVARPRPYQCLESVRRVTVSGVAMVSYAEGRPRSMPSAHVANCAALTMTAALVFGWRRWRWLLAAPLLMMVSRVYTGDHFPLDTVAGLLLGVGYTWLICCIADKLWQTFARRFAPKYYEQHPALLAGSGR
ncbi:MAG: phosphatase PAP2 family protein [Verrucomicrobiales bacterium]|jgi:undecaprenyl-diphosphatase|nr:phosphatase PAP2 family protein [Verrucomicrobiales bacterium]